MVGLTLGAISIVAEGVAVDLTFGGGEGAAAGVLSPHPADTRAINIRAPTIRAAGPLADNFYDVLAWHRLVVHHRPYDSAGLDAAGPQLAQEVVPLVLSHGDEKAARRLRIA